MPRMEDLSPKQWAAYRCSLSLWTYELLDNISDGSSRVIADLPPGIKERMPDLLAAEWVKEEDGRVTITEAGLKHLDSF